MASFLSITQEVHVLLVEHDPNHLMLTKQLLEFFSYKVKCVECASSALSMLSNGKENFDIVMANIHSSDSCTINLVKEAVKMDLLLILMCDFDDDMMARSALEQGAFLFLPKPIKMENVKPLWQHVWRNKIWKIKEKQQLDEAMNTITNGAQLEEAIPLENTISVGNNEVENELGPTEKTRDRKNWIEWTPELHNKFLDAIIELGDGRCYPKDILELMNVPGLTRMQVASHLQKCRRGRWRPCKYERRNSRNVEVSQDVMAKKRKYRRFGTMPILSEVSEKQNLKIDEKAIHDDQIYDLNKDKNLFYYDHQIIDDSQQVLSGLTFFEDAAITEVGAFMHSDPFMFDFDNENLGLFDFDHHGGLGLSSFQFQPGPSVVGVAAEVFPVTHESTHEALAMVDNNQDGAFI